MLIDVDTLERKSGLGLDAQRESVLKHVEQEGGTLIAEFSDVISGASETREQQADEFALQHYDNFRRMKENG